MRSDNPNCIKATLLGHLRSLLVTVEKVADLMNEPLGIEEEFEREWEKVKPVPEDDTVESTEPVEA